MSDDTFASRVKAHDRLARIDFVPGDKPHGVAVNDQLIVRKDRVRSMASSNSFSTFRKRTARQGQAVTPLADVFNVTLPTTLTNTWLSRSTASPIRSKTSSS